MGAVGLETPEEAFETGEERDTLVDDVRAGEVSGLRRVDQLPAPPTSVPPPDSPIDFGQVLSSYPVRVRSRGDELAKVSIPPVGNLADATLDRRQRRLWTWASAGLLLAALLAVLAALRVVADLY